MESYSNVLAQSLERYFKTIKHYGHYKDLGITKLLILIYVNELLSDYYNIPIIDSEYEIIQKALLCLFGSECIIPYPYYINYNEGPLFGQWLNTSSYRIDESSTLRIEEQGAIREAENEFLLHK